MSSPTAGSKPYVLITGATGMVGSQLMAMLLARQVPVAVLVRDIAATAGSGPVSAQRRVEHLLAKFESYWGRRLKRPVVLTGDINADCFGLCDASQRWLGYHCRSVIHSAASLSFRPASESPANEPYRSNVGGTSNVATLCRELGVASFHYISTAYVCGVREGQVTESDLQCGQRFANDYEQSKLQAERLLREQFDSNRLTIYRPSIVIDSTGMAPTTQERTIYSAFSMFYSLAIKFGLPDLGTWSGNLGLSGTERKNLVEAAWIAEVIAGIVEAPDLHGRTYHLTSRHGTPTSQMEQAFHEVTVESIRSQRPHPTLFPADAAPRGGEGNPAFHPTAAGLAARGGGERAGDSKSPAGSLTGSAVLDAIAAPFVEAYLPHFRDDPVFDRENIDAALKRLGLPEQAEIDAKVLAAMLRLPGCSGSNINRPILRSPVPNESIRYPTNACRVPIRSAGTGRKTLGDLLGEPGSKSARPDTTWCSDTAWGIVICGSGGGDYCVDVSDELRVYPGGEACKRRIYLSGDDWEAIIDGGCNVDELITAGRLLVERDAFAESSPELTRDLPGAVAELMDRLRQMLRGVRAADAVPATSWRGR